MTVGIGVGIAIVGVVAAMDSLDIEVAASPRMCDVKPEQPIAWAPAQTGPIAAG